MQVTNKYYDVVDDSNKLLYRGFCRSFVGDHVQIELTGPFGSGVKVARKGQLRPYQSVTDHSSRTARTKPGGVF